MTNLKGVVMSGYVNINAHLAELAAIADSLHCQARLLERLSVNSDEYTDGVAATITMMYAHSNSIRRASNAILDLYEANSREFQDLYDEQ